MVQSQIMHGSPTRGWQQGTSFFCAANAFSSPQQGGWPEPQPAEPSPQQQYQPHTYQQPYQQPYPQQPAAWGAPQPPQQLPPGWACQYDQILATTTTPTLN